MYIILHKINKKENSTKQPIIDSATLGINVNLKDESDVLHPIFELTAANFNHDYNYIEATWFGARRFYFIRNIITVSATIVNFVCEIDVLATWKSFIVSSEQFISRCSDASLYIGSDSEYLNDSANPATIKATTLKKDEWDLFDRSGGYYVIGFNAKKIDHPLTVRGSVSYVVMNRTDLNVFKTNLFTLTGSTGDLAPIQYIVSCVYIPLTFDSTAFNEYTESIELGGSYTVSIHYREFKNPQSSQGLKWYDHDVDLGDHPQAPSMGYFLNYDPYRKAHLIASSFGDFDLPVSIMSNLIHYHIMFDLTDGSAILEVTNQYTLPADKIIYMRINGQIGTNIALAQVVTNSTLDAYKVGSHLAASYGSAITLNVGRSISEMGAAVMSAYEGNIPKLSTSGSNGSIASIGTINTNIEYVSIIDTDLKHVGKPIFKNVALNTITTGSFIMCRNALIEIDGFIEEERKIESYMNNGFYLE